MKQSKRTKRSIEEYLNTHLKNMDEVKRNWYMNAMMTWKKEDYEKYEKFHLWMLGDLDDKSLIH
jgi:hypothetical protein